MNRPRTGKPKPPTPVVPGETDPWQAYAGRWIALVNGQVAGVGDSREAAWSAARRSRPRERVQEVRYIPPLPALDDQGPSP